jgi:hypothetical protein
LTTKVTKNTNTNCFFVPFVAFVVDGAFGITNVQLSAPEFLNTLERSGLSTWIRESESAFAYYFVLVIHNIGLALLVGACGVLGARLLGFVPELPLAPLRRYFRFVWAGFWLNVVSGVFLLIAYPTKALTNPVFYVKLVLIAVGVVALKRIERQLLVGASARAATAAVERSLALWMLASWLGVLTAGRALAYTATYLLYGKGT